MQSRCCGQSAAAATVYAATPTSTCTPLRARQGSRCVVTQPTVSAVWCPVAVLLALLQAPSSKQLFMACIQCAMAALPCSTTVQVRWCGMCGVVCWEWPSS